LKQTILRESNGRILGRLDVDQWFSQDDEFYKDQKCKDVVFPSHKGSLHGECITYNIKDLKWIKLISLVKIRFLLGKY
jgi:hypothetical protein